MSIKARQKVVSKHITNMVVIKNNNSFFVEYRQAHQRCPYIMHKHKAGLVYFEEREQVNELGTCMLQPDLASGRE